MIDGTKVLTALSNFPNVCAMIFRFDVNNNFNLAPFKNPKTLYNK